MLRWFCLVFSCLFLFFGWMPGTIQAAGREIGFTDIDGHQAEWDIKKLAKYGILSGTENGRFRPNDPITQEQVLMLAARVFSLPAQNFTEELPSGQDGSRPSDYASRFVQSAYEKGWFKTIPGYQKPVTRLWMVETMLQAIGYTEKEWDSQVAKYSDTGSLGQRERRMLQQANRLEIVRESQGGPFYPERSIMRGEAISLLVRTYDVALSRRLIKPLVEPGTYGVEDPTPRRTYAYIVETLDQKGEVPELKRSIEMIQKYGDRLTHAMILGYYFRETVHPDFAALAGPSAILIGDTLQPAHPVHEHLTRLREKGVKTLLSLQNWNIGTNGYDAKLAHRWLADPRSRSRLVKEIVEYVKKDGHIGVNINFESIWPSTRDPFALFLIELKTALKPVNAELTVTIPSFTSVAQGAEQGYDLLKISQAADYVMPMVYDYHIPSLQKAGPSAPYDWTTGIVDFNVRYFGKGKVIPIYQLNGWVWSSPQLGIPVPGREDQEAPMYVVSQWMARYNVEPQWEATVKSWQLQFKDGPTSYEVWYDDSEALRWKIKLVSQNDLAGVALWRLGVETDEFWQMVERTIRPKRQG